MTGTMWYILFLHAVIGGVASWFFYREQWHAKNYLKLVKTLNYYYFALQVAEKKFHEWRKGVSFEEACPEAARWMKENS